MADRTPEFAKNQAYESLLEAVNASVEGWGEEEGASPSGPILFIVGAPRSGTTLLYQLLAATGDFGYPSNLIARFYRSPAWGSRVQRLLEPLLPLGEMGFTSKAGNTENWWGPHELGYFWERHFDLQLHHEPRRTELAPLARALAAFEAEETRPLLFKVPILCFVLKALADALPTARFLWIQRPCLDVAASILQTRIQFFGNAEAWWSVRPHDARDDVSPAEQIAHQLARIHRALSQGRDHLGDRMARVRYADICRNPSEGVRRAGELVGIRPNTTGIPEAFSPSETRTDPEVRAELEAALRARIELDEEAWLEG